MNIEKSDIYKQWKADCERIRSGQFGISVSNESESVRNRRIERARKDYAYFVSTYFPHVAKKPCARFQMDAAKYILGNRNTRAVFEWARGHAKSTHMDVFIPLWLKIQPEPQFHTMVLVGKSADSAERLLADLQEELQYNELYIADFGKQMKEGCWADGEFTTADNCHFIAVGRGQSPRGIKYKGQRPDYIVIDDLDDDEMCRNKKRVEEATDWTLTALFGAMEAGRGRFIMVGNRISQTSVLANMAELPGVYHTRVNILDAKGKPSWKENYTIAEINSLRDYVGERRFQKEYMNNPIIEGSVFKAENIVYGPMLKDLRQYRQLVCYTDPSWKSSAQSDYKATMLMGLTKDGHYHLLKAYADQTTVTAMIEWHYAIAKWVDGRVPVYYFMESNMLQQIIVDEFRKYGEKIGAVIPVRGDSRKKPDKFARIEALEPLFTQGLIVFNAAEKDTPGMRTLVEQLLCFQRGSRIHDDAPDALEGAIYLLTKRFNPDGPPVIQLGAKTVSRHF